MLNITLAVLAIIIYEKSLKQKHREPSGSPGWHMASSRRPSWSLNLWGLSFPLVKWGNFLIGVRILMHIPVMG